MPMQGKMLNGGGFLTALEAPASKHLSELSRDRLAYQPTLPDVLRGASQAGWSPAVAGLLGFGG